MTDTTSIKEFFTNEEWDAIYDIETKQIVWSCFKFNQQLMHNETPQVHDSVFLSGCFADRYSDEVKTTTF